MDGQVRRGDGWEPEVDRMLTRLRVRAAERGRGRPFVTLTYAQSLDGSIAAVRGRPTAMSGPAALTMTHRLRAAHDAILIGIGTLLSDDPRLTVRRIAGESPQPVVLDSRLRTPAACRLLRHPTRRPWIVCTEKASGERARGLEAAGARVFRVRGDDAGRVDLAALLDRLGREGTARLMVEGGARVIGGFLRAGAVDHVILTVAPVFLGGVRAVPSSDLAGEGKRHLPRLRRSHAFRLGGDLVVSGQPCWED